MKLRSRLLVRNTSAINMKGVIIEVTNEGKMWPFVCWEGNEEEIIAALIGTCGTEFIMNSSIDMNEVGQTYLIYLSMFIPVIYTAEEENLRLVNFHQPEQIATRKADRIVVTEY